MPSQILGQEAAQERQAKAATVLEIAAHIIYGDREETYGHPAKNLTLIAKYWSAHLDKEITVDDVCIMMMALKLARLKNTPHHRDSQVDICGYAALMERCQQVHSIHRTS